LDEALEYLSDDELLEVTPTDLRMRKKYLTKQDRERAKKAGRSA
jgi:GTP-binding protein